MINQILHILVLLKEGIEHLTDEALMLRFGEGDATAFEELLDRYEKRVLCFIRRYVTDDETAADLMQETFIRVIKASSRYTPSASFSTWVLRIARNLCTDHARKKRPHKKRVSFDEQHANESLNPASQGYNASADAPALNHEIRRKLEQAVDRLPSKQREVFVLRQMLNLSFREIAGVVEASENTVKSRMRYALEGLRVELNDFYHGSPSGGSQV